MSDQYDNTNRGVLFKNDRKENEKHADYRGSINVDGKEFWLNAWIKEGKKGKFISLSLKPKDPARQSSAPSGGKPPKPPIDEESVPF